MGTINFVEFKSYFPTNASFSGDDNKAKKQLGIILKNTSETGLGRISILNKALVAAEISFFAEITNVHQNNLCNGKGNADLAWAFYYWLHLNNSISEMLLEIDRLLLNDNTFEKIAERTVSGSKTTNTKKGKISGGLIPFAPFEWPSYVQKAYAEKTEAELTTGEGSSVWLSPYNHHTIPLLDRDDQLRILDDFIEDKREFLVTYIIAPSGAGKTRLVSQWMRKFVRDPSDNEGPEGKVKGWDAGFVEKRQEKDWEDWQPICNTLIVIDYTYNYNDVIKAISDKGKQKTGKKIRLLILDHIKPQSRSEMQSDLSLSLAVGDAKKEGTFGDFYQKEYATINLLPNKNSLKILSKIIARSASLFTIDHEYHHSDSIIIKAAEALESMSEKSAEKPKDPESKKLDTIRHPLFAALLGQALALDPERDFTKLKRRDLINLYFEPKRRIPWFKNDQNAFWNTLGPWVGCYICIATLLRGVKFNWLEASLPNDIAKDFPKRTACLPLRQLTNHIISNTDKETLRPYEPDILGETFFLMFLRDCHSDERLIEFLFKCISNFKNDKEEKDGISNFIETMTRLSRNILADDPNHPFIMQSWKSIEVFLNQKNFKTDSLAKYSISITLAQITKQQRLQNTRGNDEPNFSRSIKFEDFEKLNGSSLQGLSYSAATSYFDFMYCENLGGTDLEDRFYKLSLDFIKTEEGFLGGAMIHALFNLNFATATFLASRQPAQIKGNKTLEWTRLMVLCFGGNLDLVRELITNGAKIDEQSTPSGKTALMVACMQGKDDVIEYLLEKKAKPNLLEIEGGYSALHISIIANKEGAVDTLIKHGADINLCTEIGGMYPIQLARLLKRDKIIELLQNDKNLLEISDEKPKLKGFRKYLLIFMMLLTLVFAIMIWPFYYFYKKALKNKT